MDKISYYLQHFTKHNHEERSLGHKDKQCRVSATSCVHETKANLYHTSVHIVKKYSVVHVIYGVICWSTLEKNRMNALNATRNFYYWALYSVTCWSGEKPHKCSECHKMFLLLGTLRSHMLTHTGEKPHECSECHKKFARLSTLRSHMLTHTGQKPHECTECHKTFTRLGSLQRHMLLTHAGEKVTWMLWMNTRSLHDSTMYGSHANPYWMWNQMNVWMPQEVFTIEHSMASHADPYWRETAQMNYLSKRIFSERKSNETHSEAQRSQWDWTGVNA